MAAIKRKGLDLTGMVFGRLSALKIDLNNTNRKRKWICMCICGKECSVLVECLRSGTTRSCGCLSIENRHAKGVIHGYGRRENKASEYIIWCAMRNRCNNSNYKYFYDYGGRGIKVCERWQKSFKNFLQDMGRRPSKNHSVDRINNNGNYEPSNCKWATRREQSGNTRSNVWYEYKGERMILADWSRKFSVAPIDVSRCIKKYGFEYAYNHYMNRKDRIGIIRTIHIYRKKTYTVN